MYRMRREAYVNDCLPVIARSPFWAFSSTLPVDIIETAHITRYLEVCPHLTVDDFGKYDSCFSDAVYSEVNLDENAIWTCPMSALKFENNHKFDIYSSSCVCKKTIINI
jgi:hypothetical protein